jgi:ribbon-helix-helix CopG family protein
MESSQLADAPFQSVGPSQAYGRRLSVNVALDVGEAIDELAKRRGTTITDVIRRAVSTYKFVDDEVAAGGRILVERNGTVREVKFL